MESILLFLKIAAAVIFLDQFGLWLERKGWLYWRKKKSSSSGAGNALAEFNCFLNPNVRHVLEIKEQESETIPLKNSESSEPRR